MSQLSMRVYGIPVPQGRPRATRMGRVYDPETSRSWKTDVKAQLLAHPKRPPVPWQGAVTLVMTFHMPRPASLPKRVVHHTKRPDVDNLQKAILDAMRGVIFRDDSQVVRLVADKTYSESPGVEIDVIELHG